jgi:hypothetical protein
MMAEESPKEYLISLCNAAQEANESFSDAVRIGASDSRFKSHPQYFVLHPGSGFNGSGVLD